MIKILLALMLLFSATTSAEVGSFDFFDDDINEQIRLENEENERIRLAQQNIESSSDSISDSSSNEISGSVSVNNVSIYDLNYWETIEYFGLTSVWTWFPSPE